MNAYNSSCTYNNNRSSNNNKVIENNNNNKTLMKCLPLVEKKMK